MPAERLSMRKIYEVLRLKYGHGLSNREVALSVSVSRSTVADYLLRVFSVFLRLFFFGIAGISFI